MPRNGRAPGAIPYTPGSEPPPQLTQVLGCQQQLFFAKPLREACLDTSLPVDCIHDHRLVIDARCEDLKPGAACGLVIHLALHGTGCRQKTDRFTRPCAYALAFKVSWRSDVYRRALTELCRVRTHCVPSNTYLTKSSLNTTPPGRRTVEGAI